MKINVYNREGKIVKEISIEDKILNNPFLSLIHQEVVSYLSNQRLGTASTKTRSEVSGGGKRPWRQKGTGRARASSIRSPLWRGGGVIFGPKPRDYHYSLPKKMKKIARRSAFAAKIKEGSVLVVDQIKVEKPKTKEIVNLLKNLKAEGKILFLLEHLNKSLERSLKNIKDITFLPWKDLNTYQLINSDHIIISEKEFALLWKNMILSGIR
ncbi:MAG: 50S ribosomal protein L4 [bacterium (Candidatus Ratteibacteria) CG_4_10_14_3_um_filter_41_18]|uniref:Large ribosomal subunit protein uL4 n=4 Tax=Candidatus Ratteibacteria TaxID=2979319 RepID=A0A2M7YF58_9BACT|nr:MAG: 50S ribosomal protein L4 [Candidatus Omnitrophica bacterium CG1_02_41_171]PIV64345.1 MAG: 50S ribosomal protein L4 [bacterium (Candidatus Ratteibacteria) CG01_land_8_20_14_3_00_40_19]PIW34291.1 MAG: 50S ribosomal protein L4 [bacterium (Candidatus Ratteibacteria) CG15_BIG_FIL_POST_REV_8_21_14_020_41_12]PIW74043.1 MAG: 50S ribosomal protein L4 [bacterium (Candidatus Ratteibacteria) CG_4_8_14_3_um_filter_41_36]PIX76969.1 MAG: 50S ribosomal protein L4 [bacterium (Candidatus Ratteibacteria) 